MPRIKEPEIYIARSSGVLTIDGTLYRYVAGRTRVQVGHPLLKAKPAAFMPMTVDYKVETA